MRNKFEDLIKKLLKKAKLSFKYESEKLPYVIEAEYLPDFVITVGKNQKVYIETKGFFKPSDRRKMLAVKKAHPDKDIRLWFQRDNYLTKSKNKRYSDWAKQHGFKYYVGEEFPEDEF